MKAVWRFLHELLHEPPPPRPSGHRPRGRRHHGHHGEDDEERRREADDQVGDAAADGPAPGAPHDPHHH